MIIWARFMLIQGAALMVAGFAGILNRSDIGWSVFGVGVCLCLLGIWFRTDRS